MAEITRLTKVDFDEIIERLDEFWGMVNDKLLFVHHPMFLHEFGDTAFVARVEGELVAYLFGFVAQTDPTLAHGQVIACLPNHRGRAAVSGLVEHFFAVMRERGCKRVKSLVFPYNYRSLLFHYRLGFKPGSGPETETNASGIVVSRDYWGKGIDYVVLYHDL